MGKAQCSIRNNRYSLVRGKEHWSLYDFKADPGQNSDIADQHADVVATLSAAYDQWWQEVRPRLENEEAYKTAPQVNPFKAQYAKQFGGEPDPNPPQKKKKNNRKKLQ